MPSPQHLVLILFSWIANIDKGYRKTKTGQLTLNCVLSRNADSEGLISLIPIRDNLQVKSKSFHSSFFYFNNSEWASSLSLLKTKKALRKRRTLILFVDSEGFEPPVPYGTIVFKITAFDHSANYPRAQR